MQHEKVQRLSLVGQKFGELSSFTETETERVVRELAEELGVKAAKLIHPIRLAVTGKQVGPGLFEMLEVLGKKRVTDRIARFVALSSSQA